MSFCSVHGETYAFVEGLASKKYRPTSTPYNMTRIVVAASSVPRTKRPVGVWWWRNQDTRFRISMASRIHMGTITKDQKSKRAIPRAGEDDKRVYQLIKPMKDHDDPSLTKGKISIGGRTGRGWLWMNSGHMGVLR
jgi:hypothetical protein